MHRSSKDDAFDLSDSTDWLETPLPLLSTVDSALRCQVCKDFYTTPMITSCSHTFCSLCIRRCLNNDGRCPACRAQDQELKLRFNAAMEDLVEAFKNARPEVWEFANKSVDELDSTSPPKRSRELEEGEGGSPRKRTRSSGRRRGKERVVVADSAEDDEDYVPEEGLVQCPVCQNMVKEDTINLHLDRNCMDEPRVTKPLGGTLSQPAASKSSLAGKSMKRPERLPQLHYSMVKDNILRKKLLDLGLSAGGTRQLLEKRYTEWVTLWNANCDATKPKSKGELRRELDIWERSQGSKAGGSKQDSGAQIKEKDFDGQAWSSKHDYSFRQLIADARKKAAIKPSTPEPSEAVDLTGTPTPAKKPDPRSVELSESHVEAEMTNNDLPPQESIIEESPMKASSQRRFFDETTKKINDPSQLPPSSQYSILDIDSVART